MIRRPRTLLALAIAGVAALSSCARHRVPDVVVVTLDTVRADRLGCYGNGAGLTRYLDALASRAVVFEDASCATPVTLPSHATLFTGRYPTQTGVRNNGTFIVPASETTLAEMLREKGWRTGAVIAAFPLQSRFGLAQGFEIYDEDLPALPPPAEGAFSVHFNERDARAVTDRALQVWTRLSGGPRFLWVHYFDAHAPYSPPEPWATTYAAARYDGEIAYVDAELGRLLERVEHDAPGAIVVIAGDHGEGLGEHGEKTHGVFLYQSTVRVPLLIRAPGRFPDGARVEVPVSLADVVPTILRLTGIAIPGPVDGTDLGPAVAGQPLAVRDVYAESYLALLQFRFSPLTMLRAGPLKYIDAPSPELYDVLTDASESHNLAGSSAQEPELAARLAAIITHVDPEAASRAAGGLDAETEARLRSLGYASAGTLAARGAGPGRDPKTMVDYLKRYDHAVGLVAAGRIDEGLVALRALIPEAPENYMARYQVAAGLMAAGRADEARVELQRVVSAAAEFGSGHLMLAESLAAMGRLDDAVASFDTAALRMPTQAEPKLAKGRALLSFGRFDAAATAFQEAIEREPTSRETVRALVALRAGRGDLARLAGELQALATRFPSSTALAIALAEVLHRAGDDHGATEALQRALAIDPENSDALMMRATLLFDAGHPERAADDYRRVLRGKAGLRAAELGLGRALAVAGPVDEAEAMISQLQLRYPADAEPIALRGLLTERQGDVKAAQRAYRDALAIDPRCAEARRGLDRLMHAPAR